MDSKTGELKGKITAHPTSIVDVAFSPDGMLIASSSQVSSGPGTIITESDQTVRIWEVEQTLGTHELFPEDAKYVLTNVGEFVYDFQFSANNEWFAYRQLNCCNVLWNLAAHTKQFEVDGSSAFAFSNNDFLYQDGSHFVRYDLDRKHPSSVTPIVGILQFDTFGGDVVPYIVSRNELRVWNDETFEVLQLQNAQDINSGILAGGRFVSAVNTEIKLWSAITGEQISELTGFATGRSHTDAVLSPDGQLLAYTFGGGHIHIRNPILDGETTTISGDRPRAFSPDNKVIVFSDSDTNVLWDIAKNTSHAFLLVGHAVFSPDGTKLAVLDDRYGGEPRTVAIYDVATGSKLHALNIAATDALFNADATKLMLAETLSISLWDMETGQQIGATPQGNYLSSGMDFRSNGRPVAGYASQFSSMLQIYDVSTGKRRHYMQLPKEGEVSYRPIYYSPYRITFSPNGDYVAFSLTEQYERETVYLWNLSTDEQKIIMDGIQSTLSNFTFSADSKLLLFIGGDYVVGASLNLDRTFYIYDVASGKQLNRLFGHNAPLTSLSITPDNRLIMSTSRDGTIRFWGVPVGD